LLRRQIRWLSRIATGAAHRPERRAACRHLILASLRAGVPVVVAWGRMLARFLLSF
jgi:hypothetical protein